MLQFIAEHQLLVRVLCAPLALLFAMIVTASAVRPASHPGRHERGVHRGTPAEIVRHRLGGWERTWPDTRSLRLCAPLTTHALDGHTGEISLTSLEQLMARSRSAGAHHA